MPDDKKKYTRADYFNLQNTMQPVREFVDVTDPNFQETEPEEPSFLDKMESLNFRFMGLNPVTIGKSVVGGLEGAHERHQESQKAGIEGDVLGSELGKASAIARGGFAGLTAISPHLQAFTQGISDISKVVPEDILKYATNPVTSLTKPESLAGRSAAEIGDIAAQLLLAKGIAKGTKSFSPTTPKGELKLGDVKQEIKIKDPLKEQAELEKMLEKEVTPKSEVDVTKPPVIETTPKQKVDKLVEQREEGVRQEQPLEALEERLPQGEEVFNVRQTKEYKELRDDGTQTFKNALEEAKLYKGITEESLLKLDPRTLRDKTGKPYTFNKAQQIKIDAIALNKVQQVVQKRQGWGKQLSEEQLLELDQGFMDASRLQALAKNNVREAARVLESQRRKHSLSQEEIDLLNEVAEELGKKKDASFKEINDILEPKFKDKALFWWYNSILSNPLTDVANILGNATMLGWEIGTQPKALLNGSVLRGIIEGSKNAKKVWTGETRASSKYTEGRLQAHADILKTKGKWTTRVKNTLLPTSRLSIEDAFFRSIFENMREKQVSKQLAKEYGTTEKVVTEQLEKIIKGEESNLIDPKQLAEFEKQVNAIENYATEMVFQKPLGETGRKVQGALNSKFGLPIKLTTMPFLRIAVNLTKASLKSSPIGYSKLFGKNFKNLTKLEQKDIIRRATAGTMLYAGIMKAVDEWDVEIIGDLGTIPKSRRELLEASGYRENSVVVTNKDGSKTAVPFQNVSPINILLGAIGTLYTQSQWGSDDTKERGAVETAWKGILAVANSLGNQSFLQGVAPMLNALKNGDPSNINNMLVRLSTPNLLSLMGSADLEILGAKPRKIFVTESLIDEVRKRFGLTNEIWGMDALQIKSDVFGGERVTRYKRFPIPTTQEQHKVARLLLFSKIGIGDYDNPIVDGKRKYSERRIAELNKAYRGNLFKLMNESYDELKGIWEETKNTEVGNSVLKKMVDTFKEIAKYELLDKYEDIIIGDKK